MLPKQQIRWLASFPDSVLSPRAVHDVKFATKYLVAPITHAQETAVTFSLRQGLTRNLGRAQLPVFDALRSSIDQSWGYDETTWNEVSLFETLQHSVHRAVNCILVGSPLCHEEKYLDGLSSFASWVGIGSLVVGQFTPWFLAPVFGKLIRVPVSIYRRRSMQYLQPAIEDRMRYIERSEKDKSSIEAGDLITWIILNSRKSTAVEIGDMILGLSLGSIHTTILAATNFFLDLVSSPPEASYYESLRTEAASTFKTQEDWGKLASLFKLSLTDSAVRETLRISPPVGRGVMRQVMHRDGLTLPGGQHLPKDAWVGVSVHGINHDDRFYPDPDQFKPFRFARSEAKSSDEPSSPTTQDVEGPPNDAYLATAEDKFMSFGYGRHSCPGRWFAAHLLKLLVAYITLNYEIQPVAKRPENIILGDSIVPPRSFKIKVRRRRHAE
ncbi:MAG: hypothetical protein Q9195_003725 [Heterodermia aff. obscurata]